MGSLFELFKPLMKKPNHGHSSKGLTVTFNKNLKIGTIGKCANCRQKNAKFYCGTIKGVIYIQELHKSNWLSSFGSVNMSSFEFFKHL